SSRLLSRSRSWFDGKVRRWRRAGFGLCENIRPTLVAAVIPGVLILGVLFDLLLILRSRRHYCRASSVPDSVDRIRWGGLQIRQSQRVDEAKIRGVLIHRGAQALGCRWVVLGLQGC